MLFHYPVLTVEIIKHQIRQDSYAQ